MTALAGLVLFLSTAIPMVLRRMKQRREAFEKEWKERVK